MVYMGEACAQCADGEATSWGQTRRSFRTSGKCKKCPDVLWLPYVLITVTLFAAGPALRVASQMEDGFGAINIAIAFSQVRHGIDFHPLVRSS